MILVTGAAGKTGRAVIRALNEKMQLVRALIFRAEQIQEVKRSGASEAIVGDLRDPELLKRAMHGVDAVYHICPNVHPDEIEIGKAIIAAAAGTRGPYFVYHSVLHPQIEAMPHHWKKMRVEEKLFEAGVAYSILQPAVYMQNILANWETIIKKGKYIIPYGVNSRISMVDLEDVAEAASCILIEAIQGQHQPLHLGATYELVGTQAMTQVEVAESLSRYVGCAVEAERLPIDIWERRARDSGMGDYQVDSLVKMFAYYDKYGLAGDSHVLGWILHRPPVSFDDFVKHMVETSIHRVQ